jgi:hypothetical protein
MALQKMIVSAARGTEDSPEACFPYEFYAKETKDAAQTRVIQLVMPLGGKESGLFRYPKDGEAILVDDDGMPLPKYYLMGYLPSAADTDNNNNFLTNPDAGESSKAFAKEQALLKNEEGMILRYQQTGKITSATTDAASRYSEIGFYHRKTQWRTKDKAYWDVVETEDETDAAYSKRLVKAGIAKSDNDETDSAHIARVTGIHNKWLPRGSEGDADYSKRLVAAGIAQDLRTENYSAHIERATGIHDRWLPRGSESDADYSKRLVAAGIAKKSGSETDAAHIERVTGIHDRWFSRGPESDADYSKRLVAAGIAKVPSTETDAAHIARAGLVYTNWIPRIEVAIFPGIDQINIQSTGDIHTKAANHQRMKARRIEILSNVDESDFTKDLSGKNRPFGDKGADVSNLFQGDIHIRGKRRIVLKAGSEIRLEVGRSAIVISDAGITLSSRKTHSDIRNSLDTILSVLPRDGITMFGQHLKLGAAYDWAIMENMGSSIKGTAGIMRLEGKDIKASTISGVAYITNFIAQTAAFVNNLTAVSVGKNDSDDVQSSKIPSYTGMATGLLGILVNIFIGGAKTGDSDDPDTSIVKYSAIALQLVETVLGVIETLYIDPEDKTAKDNLALAGIIIEWGLLLPVFGIICSESLGPYLLHNDSVHLGNNGHLAMVGTNIKQFSLNSKNTNSPLSGFNPPKKNDGDDKTTGQKVLDFVKKYWKPFVIVATGIGVGTQRTMSKMDSISKDQKEMLDQLNEL